MGDRTRVLVVDDEQPLARIVASYLQAEGFNAQLAFDGPSAVELARDMRPDLIVLDLMLPGFDGIEVCRQVRTFSDCYIIMLTARDDEVDKVVGLSVGADDYVVKPFSPRELVARTKALLRRPRTMDTENPTSESDTDTITLRQLRIEPLARHARIGEVELELTRTEFDLLTTLCRNPRQVLSRRQLIDTVWGREWFGDEHLVDVHIGHLRRKLNDDAAEPEWIRTVRGVGYGMVT
mgnify:FL=1